MWTYILLGILQGVLEWLPVSSEGMVSLVSRFLLRGTNPVDIALFLHLGTLLAVVIYFWKDWKEVLTFGNLPFLRFLIISTTLSLIIGFPIYKIIREKAIGNSLLVIVGMGLLATSYFHKKRISFNLDFGNKLAFLVGTLQGLAVIPGLSRSGATVFGLSLGEIKPSDVLKFSYMMSVPVVFASSIYLSLENQDLVWEALPALLSSFLSGILSLHFLLKITQKTSFFKFTFAFGVLCLFGALLGFLI